MNMQQSPDPDARDHEAPEAAETPAAEDHNANDQAAEAEAADEAGRRKVKSRRLFGSKKRIAELEEQVAQLKDKNLRLRAEFDNFRKRSQRDLQDARVFSRIDTLEQMLPVLDHFQMAMTHADSSPDLATLRQGMDMILQEFERAFVALGVEKIPTVGVSFDPNLHEAISTAPSADVPEGEILREWKAGYRLGERLLRAPAVVVSSGPAEDNDSAASADDQG